MITARIIVLDSWLQPQQFDVVVVGARAAGAATAMLLARAGLEVLVIDKSAYGTDTVSTHTIMRPGVLSLRRWGLYEALQACGAPALKTTVFHYVGDPKSWQGRSLTEGTIRRLRQAGFDKVSRAPEAFGLVAKKDGGQRRSRR